MSPRKRHDRPPTGPVTATYSGYVGWHGDEMPDEDHEQVRITVTVDDDGHLRLYGEPARLLWAMQAAYRERGWQDPGGMWGCRQMDPHDLLATLGWLRDQGVTVTDYTGLELPYDPTPPGAVN